MYKLTNQPGIDFTLQVVLYQQDLTVPIYLMYDKFKVRSESSGYMLETSLTNFRYSSRNYLSSYLYTGQRFSTMDRNNDGKSYSSASYNYYRNCAKLSAFKISGGGWWFLGSPRCYSWGDCNRYSFTSTCGGSNLNAKVPYYVGISGSPTNITRVQMKIRPTNAMNYY